MFDDEHSSTLLSQIKIGISRVQSVLNQNKPIFVPLWVMLLAALSGFGGVASIADGLLRASSSTALAEPPSITHSTQIAYTTRASGEPLDSPGQEKGGSLVVEVAGAVLHPGVYNLESDARVADALDQAGGVISAADSYYLSRVINLSTKVQDGQKIYVPTLADQSVELACSQVLGDLATAGSESSPSSAPTDELVSINSATQAQLETLPGIGAKRAADIIGGRPYTDVDQLLITSIVTEKIFAEIQNLIKL